MSWEGRARDRVPRAFARYAAGTTVIAVALVVPAGAAAGWAVPGDVELALFAALVLLGELLPIRVPRRESNDWVTISSCFGVATLLAFGLWPAVLVYVSASVLADVAYRARAVNVTFNAAQYALALGAAAGALSLTGQGTPVDDVGGRLPGILLAGTVFFLANEVLAGAGGALLSREPVLDYLRRDIGFQAFAGGFQVALAPIVLAAAASGAALIPLCFIPLLAIFLGGRQAAINAHRDVHDDLTDLPHRAALRARLARVLARDQPVVLLALRLEEVETARATLGRPFADRLVAAAAARVRDAVPAEDVVARLDGDELGLLRIGARPGEGAGLARRALAALEEPVYVEGLDFEVHGRAGLAVAMPGERDADRLLHEADLALSTARAEERPWALHEPEDDERSRDRLALATQLRRGLQRGELRVLFQLKVPLRAGGQFGAEALARWHHPQLGLVHPEGFIPLAERTGLIAPLTAQVLDAALQRCRGWLDDGLEVRTAINVPPRLLLDETLPGRVRAALDAAGVPAGLLQLEITESRMLAESDRSTGVIAALRDLGVSLAIDDFGTGFSSLSRLRRLPFDELKIDKSFIRGMGADRHDLAVVRAAADLGRDLGLSVVAEGVETPMVARRLGELGVDHAQGYLFGRPAPADECDRLLRSLSAEGAEPVSLGAWRAAL